jgi:hypothetical protein
LVLRDDIVLVVVVVGIHEENLVLAWYPRSHIIDAPNYLLTETD